MILSMLIPRVLLPHPDSPTRPKTVFASISKLTPSTARTYCLFVSGILLTGKYFARDWTETRVVIFSHSW